MRIVVALGGNALMRRGAPLTVANQRANVAVAAAALVPLAAEHELVITHGNGPQVGLLALQAAAYDGDGSYPFDVLGAQTEGMIGYLIEQELGNRLPAGRSIATVLTMTEVDADDPAFDEPQKLVGPVYEREEAERLAQRHGWVVRPDGLGWRRVVASPLPRRIVELRPIRTLLDAGCVVICAGGGGIPTTCRPGTHSLVGAEAVVDKDRASAVLARDLGADFLVIVTDTDAVYTGWGTADARPIRSLHPRELARLTLPEGSMRPKLEAAAQFADTGRDAVIGGMGDLSGLLTGRTGTLVSTRVEGLTLR